MAKEIKCPKCGSTQITANKKGFSLGKAIAGTVAVGPVGAIAGVHGSSNIIISCLSCGHSWTPKIEVEQAQNDISRTTPSYLLSEAWHRDFVAAYEEGRRELANSILRSNDPSAFSKRGIDLFYNDLPIHQAESRTGKQPNGIMMVVVFFIVVLAIILVFELF
ncbi:hypothetical protein GCM10007423_63220 [Dyadobacter endophyticus]|uniref:Uncharacterized protein n=1 Tax=Dyadobacter endophyticus TaxID=1749036 RepID=A0ABQ1ZAI2_9BACT|nr:hypothetical protein [Dyadobacter endophyticus]GGH55559.1 hypothetical protein GCM10007423_63220 [Dyadobacter endophyticus]